MFGNGPEYSCGSLRSQAENIASTILESVHFLFNYVRHLPYTSLKKLCFFHYRGDDLAKPETLEYSFGRRAYEIPFRGFIG
jgi:hypothetical protein